MPSFPGSVRVPSGAERQFGEFTLLLKLGWGGMADVFLAKGPEQELVVVKRLKADLAFDPDHRSMFEAESKLALRFDHPNVVRALRSGEVDGQPYLVLEYLEGQPLDRVIGEAALPQPEALEIVRCLLAGLDYAHELTDERGERLDIVHRDVSPHNVFITTDGKVKLVDFGIAKSRLGEQHTVTGVVKGKLAYMAPEQALANAVDRRADLFAAGVVLCELLGGRRYWGSLSDVQILKAMTFGELPKLPIQISANVARVLGRALTATPDQRFPSAAAFREALAALPNQHVTPEALGAVVQRVARTDPESVRHMIRAQLAELTPPPPPESKPAAAMMETSDGQALPLVAPPAPSKLRSRLPWVAALGVFALAVVAVALRFANATPPVTKVAEVPIPSPSTAASATATPATTVSTVPNTVAPVEDPRDQITVRLVASPASARIQLDGVDLAANPFVAKFPRDGAAHKLIVSAAGFAESAELVVFDKDLVLERRLVATRPGAPASSARPSASFATSGPHVDNRDPWAPRPH
ncbi:MAG: serine/threonine-protein kinase [Polyangiaceae bacterium]